jgi:hypothetical protein
METGTGGDRERKVMGKLGVAMGRGLGVWIEVRGLLGVTIIILYIGLS